MKSKAFTLVELLVVISIVSMLASVVMVQVSLAQAKGRDSVRAQQIRQIDLATRMYVEKYQKAPPLTGCDIVSQISSVSPTEVSACFAVSTAAVNTPQADNWIDFKDLLSEFIAVPDDPCRGSCIPADPDYPIGYTYVAPLAVQYHCAQTGDCVATDESYQVYAPLERQATPSGSGGSASGYATPPDAPSTPTVIVNVRLNGTVLPYSQASSCVATVFGPNGFQDTAGCVRSMSERPLGVYSVQWENGYPTGADTSKTPIIYPSYPLTLGEHPSGSNPVIFYIDFQ